MACRTLLSKLELQGYIILPRRRSPGRGGYRKVFDAAKHLVHGSKLFFNMIKAVNTHKI